MIDQIAGLAGHASSLPCNPTRPVSVLHIHGTGDATVPYETGVFGGVHGLERIGSQVVLAWLHTRLLEAPLLPSLGLIGAGFAACDPISGYPVGSPIPAPRTAHGIAHDLFSTPVVGYTDPLAVMSIYGPTGATAYFGMTGVGKPQPGETVVVSAAAGATGSVVIQLARAHGCRAGRSPIAVLQNCRGFLPASPGSGARA